MALTNRQREVLKYLREYNARRIRPQRRNEISCLCGYVFDYEDLTEPRVMLQRTSEIVCLNCPECTALRYISRHQYEQFSLG